MTQWVTGFFKRGCYAPLLLLAALLLYNPDLFFHPAHMRESLAFSAGSSAFLALALLLFDFRRTVNTIAAMKRGTLLALGGFFCIAY